MERDSAVQPKYFLIVDDDKDDIEFFTEALADVDSSCICYSAIDGFQALKTLNERHLMLPTIIFLDLNMPRMNGWELLSELKKDNRYKHIPVIIHSTSSANTDREQAKIAGALCFVTKRYDFESLKEMIRTVTMKLKENQTNTLCETLQSQHGGRYGFS